MADIGMLDNSDQTNETTNARTRDGAVDDDGSVLGSDADTASLAGTVGTALMARAIQVNQTGPREVVEHHAGLLTSTWGRTHSMKIALSVRVTGQATTEDLDQHLGIFAAASNPSHGAYDFRIGDSMTVIYHPAQGDQGVYVTEVPTSLWNAWRASNADHDEANLAVTSVSREERRAHRRERRGGSSQGPTA